MKVFHQGQQKVSFAKGVMRLGESITFYLPQGQHRFDVIDVLKCITTLFSRGEQNAEVDEKVAWTRENNMCFETHLHMQHNGQIFWIACANIVVKII